MNGKHAFVVMIKEKWWNEFRRRRSQGKETHAYIQRGTAPPKDTSLILFYVVKPVGELAGHAEFIERKVGEAGKLWKEHGKESVLNSKKNYEEFVKGAKKVSFIRFNNLVEAAKPIPLRNLLMLLGVKRLARKGFYLDKETTDKFMMSME